MIKDGENVNNSSILSFLMIGQSNMAGRGNLGEVPEIVNPDCYMLRMGRWQRMQEPINVDRPLRDIPYTPGVGLAASFADTLSHKLESKIGLIPCADGGTKISQWMPGEVLFDHAVAQCWLAMRTSTLGGIIWHQGESDSGTDKDVYKANLVTMLTALREELGMPELPIVAGEISHNISPEWNISGNEAKINGVLSELCDELPSFALATSEGLSMKADGIHFNSASCRLFGVRYAEKYLELIEK